MSYQTHSKKKKGMVDSGHRLQRLQIPADLAGKSVLDIGCNEGFYCNVAADRGADRIVGIDQWASALATAKELYGQRSQIRFLEQSWQLLPEGLFDLVLWTSAMHYELDPLKILRQVADRLNPDGMLILECGVADGPGKEMARLQRNDGAHFYPTWRFLEEHLLADFVVSRVAEPELIGDDLAPRAVYHCRKRKPVVLLLRRDSKNVKPAAASAIFAASTKTISTDMFLHRLMTAKFQHTPLEKFIFSKAKNFGPAEVYEQIDAQGLTEEYAKEIARGVAATDRLVVIEGHITDLQVDALARLLKNRAEVRDAAPPE